MSPYFYRLDEDFFQGPLRESLTESWTRHSFTPSLGLCRQLVEKSPAADSVIHAVLHGLPFDRHLWQALVGECIVYGASDIPRLDVDPVSLCHLCGAAGLNETPRDDFAPIQQVLFGSHDLRFANRIYRPNHVGANEFIDVNRLHEYLRAVELETWTDGAVLLLPGMEDAETRTQELAYCRDGWPELVRMYAEALARNQVIVCEVAESFVY